MSLSTNITHVRQVMAILRDCDAQGWVSQLCPCGLCGIWWVQDPVTGGMALLWGGDPEPYITSVRAPQPEDGHRYSAYPTVRADLPYAANAIDRIRACQALPEEPSAVLRPHADRDGRIRDS